MYIYVNMYIRHAFVLLCLHYEFVQVHFVGLPS